jgi:mRNA-degrading endonuclease RelE of RelBE toxin-antitoxin system
MDFRIADTFTGSLARLTSDEQRAVKTTAFDLQLDPSNPGMQFHKLERAKDKRFWSVRVSSDLRLIVHKTDSSLLLCYTDHHDAAYRWAERRKLEAHPTTGAAQLVEVRETVLEITVPRYTEVEVAHPQRLLFDTRSEAELLSYGVPPEWLEDVRAATEDSLLTLTDHLPAEAAEALLDLATGVTPQVAEPIAAGVNPFDHPDAQRRFRVMNDIEELERALEYPWEKWTVFLHPAQEQLVARDYSGPARVSGSAGTGKTIVALHRAAHLVRTDPDARVLLTTFSDTLANALRTKVWRLIGDKPQLGERLDVLSMNAVGRRLYEPTFGKPKVATTDIVRDRLEAASKGSEHPFTLRFLLNEWEQVVDAWQLKSWEQYRDVSRLGRKTRLPEKQRAALWEIFGRLNADLDAEGLVTYEGMFTRLAGKFSAEGRSPYDSIVVDEAQDVSVAQLRFLAALAGGRANGLFFAGDLGQRIFQQAFSWKALGVEVRGRSRTLRVNYRTSHQIRMQADKLLGPVVSDVDGNTEERGTVSVFNGLEPTVQIFDTPGDENEAVGAWVQARLNEGLAPHELGVFVRSDAELTRAYAALSEAGVPFQVLDAHVATVAGEISVSTMHLAKGLEFRAVVVMACDDEIIPLQARIETVTDDADLAEVYDTERHLLYVACTRARDYLLVTSAGQASEFLDDLQG